MKSIIFVLCLVFIFHLSATIINIPADQSTIQEGINVAVDGDTVLVQPGTYFENIDFIGKGITVGSLFLATQDTSYITQTIIDGNELISCVTFSNGEDSSSVLSGLTITNGNFIDGGGIFCIYSSPNLLNLIVTGNNGDTGGGIACNQNSNPLIKNVVITNNSAPHAGGFVCFNSNPILKNVLIADNFSSGSAGAMSLDNSNPILENVTIANNQAQGYCGGILCSGNSNPVLTNCILWNNSPYEITFNFLHQSNSVTISYSDITGGEYGINTNDNGTINWMQGNIYADPLFFDELNGKYYLSEDSPCIDAGDPEFPNDLDGTTSDMGAYYFNQNEQAMSLTTGNIWCYQWQYGPEQGTYTITAIGDTIINNQTYEILYRDNPYPYITGYYRSDSTRVYKQHNSSEYILYDLNWELGQLVNINGSEYQVIEKGVMYFLGCYGKQYITISEDFYTPNFHRMKYTNTFGLIDYTFANMGFQFSNFRELIGAQIDGVIYGSVENPGSIAIPPYPILNQNFPNPFNPSTTFEFSIPKESKVDLSIYNIKGQIIKTIVNSEFIAGIHSIIWNGDDESNKSVSSGIYYYKLNVNGKTEAVKKCLLLR